MSKISQTKTANIKSGCVGAQPLMRNQQPGYNATQSTVYIGEETFIAGVSRRA